MVEETMPAVEAQDVEGQDVVAYECAFHILPTIADEEVPGVVEKLKGLVTAAGGVVTTDEVIPRFDLAYEITKQIDGVNRRFNAAHFGWMRFSIEPSKLAHITEELDHTPELLRHLIIRLTRAELEQPFSIFEIRRTATPQAPTEEEVRALAEARGEVVFEEEAAAEVKEGPAA